MSVLGRKKKYTVTLRPLFIAFLFGLFLLFTQNQNAEAVANKDESMQEENDSHSSLRISNNKREENSVVQYIKEEALEKARGKTQPRKLLQLISHIKKPVSLLQKVNAYQPFPLAEHKPPAATNDENNTSITAFDAQHKKFNVIGSMSQLLENIKPLSLFGTLCVMHENALEKFVWPHLHPLVPVPMHLFVALLIYAFVPAFIFAMLNHIKKYSTQHKYCIKGNTKMLLKLIGVIGLGYCLNFARVLPETVQYAIVGILTVHKWRSTNPVESAFNSFYLFSTIHSQFWQLIVCSVYLGITEMRLGHTSPQTDVKVQTSNTDENPTSLISNNPENNKQGVIVGTDKKNDEQGAIVATDEENDEQGAIVATDEENDEQGTTVDEQNNKQKDTVPVDEQNDKQKDTVYVKTKNAKEDILENLGSGSTDSHKDREIGDSLMENESSVADASLGNKSGGDALQPNKDDKNTEISSLNVKLNLDNKDNANKINRAVVQRVQRSSDTSTNKKKGDENKYTKNSTMDGDNYTGAAENDSESNQKTPKMDGDESQDKSGGNAGESGGTADDPKLSDEESNTDESSTDENSDSKAVDKETNAISSESRLTSAEKSEGSGGDKESSLTDPPNSGNH